MDRETTLEALFRETEAAFRTAFPGDGRRLVPGEGPADGPPLLLIGEAPGREEAEQGRPFVGKAGRNLDGFLAEVALERRTIRITNVVKVRPTRVSPRGTVSNRPPNREELGFFIPYLEREILLTAPRRIVTLGNTPLQALLGGSAVIGALHGRETSAEIGGRRFPLFPLYHPASLIYNPALRPVYGEDLRALAALLRAEGE